MHSGMRTGLVGGAGQGSIRSANGMPAEGGRTRNQDSTPASRKAGRYEVSKRGTRRCPKVCVSIGCDPPGATQPASWLVGARWSPR
jgi:hypothetical protein